MSERAGPATGTSIRRPLRVRRQCLTVKRGQGVRTSPSAPCTCRISAPAPTASRRSAAQATCAGGTHAEARLCQHRRPPSASKRTQRTQRRTHPSQDSTSDRLIGVVLAMATACRFPSFAWVRTVRAPAGRAAAAAAAQPRACSDSRNICAGAGSGGCAAARRRLIRERCGSRAAPLLPGSRRSAWGLTPGLAALSVGPYSRARSTQRGALSRARGAQRGLTAVHRSPKCGSRSMIYLTVCAIGSACQAAGGPASTD